MPGSARVLPGFGNGANLGARAAHEILRVLDETEASDECARVVCDELYGRVSRGEGLGPGAVLVFRKSTRRMIEENLPNDERVVDGDDVDIGHALRLKLLILLDVAGSLAGARRGECAENTNLRVDIRVQLPIYAYN